MTNRIATDDDRTTATTLLDCHGRNLAETRILLIARLGKKTSDWAPCVRVKSESLKRKLREEWCNELTGWCPVCGAPRCMVRNLELHHISGGTKGRSDERCNLIPVCVRWGEDGCHDKVREIGLMRIIEAKVQHDPSGVDFYRLSWLLNSFID